MENKKIDYCDECVKELDEFSKGIRDSRSNYLGEKNNCAIHNPSVKIHNPSVKIYNANGIIKWTDGQLYERSRRMKHQIEMEQEQFSKEMESSAYTSSLNHDENTWDILNQSLSGAGFKVSNKREELGNKLAGREMLQQIGFNPFLGQTNYVDDISIRDQFLKPINTTQDDTKVPFSS
jgi:hypothetical protein